MIQNKGEFATSQRIHKVSLPWESYEKFELLAFLSDLHGDRELVKNVPHVIHQDTIYLLQVLLKL